MDKLFKAAVKQWKVRSVMFDKEDDAKAFREAVAKGGSFDALARAAVAEKKAKGGEPGYVSVQQMVPELAHAADALKKGQVSPPVQGRRAASWSSSSRASATRRTRRPGSRRAPSRSPSSSTRPSGSSTSRW